MKDSKMDLILRLRSSRLIRRMLHPLLRLRVEVFRRRYLAGGAARKLHNLKGAYQGQRCFIVGNGPSLTEHDVKRLAGEYTFAMNRIFPMIARTGFSPSFYMAVDEDFIRREHEQIRRLNCPFKFINSSACPRTIPERVYPVFINSDVPVDKAGYIKQTISTRVEEGFSLSYSVACYCIELAIYLGFTEIYLLGIDHNFPKMADSRGRTIRNPSAKEHYDGGSYADGNVIFYRDAVTSCYEAYARYAAKHGISIVNLTRGGKLEVFPREDFEQILP